MRVRIGVIEMGRKSECWVGMAILGTGVMLASFHCYATIDVASDMLNRKATAGVSSRMMVNAVSGTPAPHTKNFVVLIICQL